MELYVLADGLHVMRYAEIWGMKPACVVWRNKSLRERLAFIPDDAELLILVQGCTTMKTSDITNVVKMLRKENVFTEICVYSNILLPNLAIPYYLYKGDLFEGTEILMYGDKPANKKSKVKNTEKYITKYLKEPYLAKTTEVVDAPYNANTEREPQNDINANAITIVNVFKRATQKV